MAGTTRSPDHTDLSSLQRRVAHLEGVARVRGRALAIASAALIGLGTMAILGADARHQLTSCQEKLVESRQAHSALARADGDGAFAPASAPYRPAPAAPLATAS